MSGHNDTDILEEEEKKSFTSKR